mmetsp:Transcript_5873/g.8060  ORF Transcript_5873/g.8060 Transcript_5873/m.8060 type:complete len:185 (-) Transcript_5873:269-823(-)|eukprot:CAMPEP_0117752048 /NCGR_PEP_ID=MMETSP0947-20121206/11374_1 /TAXON_ID=44440 /ORGANISM="Chattonella subsalsa, Strain CCMP2191" /LENGTH=184 /DNA_ID=CAMNT_0005570617 /DNA_START=63 /DNA_END=617 /DNA_ORIENTATION=-
METQNAKFSVAFLLFALSTLAFTNAFQSSAYLPSNGHVRSVRNYVNVQQSFPIKPFEKQSGKEAFVFQMAVDSVTLEGLSNYEEDGAWLSEAIKVALDEEWLPQKVHEEIGERVKNIYVQKRNEGELEVTGILVAVGTELEKVELYPAFVGPWEIANMASDFLVVKIGGDGCGCTYQVPESLKN